MYSAQPLAPAASGVKQKLACQATGNLECAKRIACGFVTAQVLSSYDIIAETISEDAESEREEKYEFQELYAGQHRR